MAIGEPTDEKLVQDYVSKFYKKRYSGSGFIYHSSIIRDMFSDLEANNHKVLDVGCGNGFVSKLYPHLDITGIDISDGMLANNPYKWVKAPAEAIPFQDNHFDFIICRSLLHHLENPLLGLQEMYRVLKPGGHWVCWDPNYSFFSEIFRWIARFTPRFSHIHKNFKDEELFLMIDNAGFTITEKKYLGFIAYPICAFPDILNFNVSDSLCRNLMTIDNYLSKSPIKKASWSLMIKAVK